MIELVHIADLTAMVGEPVEIGRRRVIPITGGSATGPKLHGRILNGGADFQIERPDGVAELQARYVLETDDGARIYVENSGLRHGSREAMEKLRRGEPVDPAAIYCRTTPRFETAAEPYLWLMRSLFVATVVRRPHQVEVAIYQIL